MPHDWVPGLSRNQRLETNPVLQKDQYPEHGCHQAGGKTLRGHRCVEGQNVYKLGSENDERQRHKEAAQEQQASNQLESKEHVCIVRSSYRCEELDSQRIRWWWLLDEIEKAIEPEYSKHQAQ